MRKFCSDNRDQLNIVVVGIIGALVALAAVIALGSLVGSFWAIREGRRLDGWVVAVCGCSGQMSDRFSLWLPASCIWLDDAGRRPQTFDGSDALFEPPAEFGRPVLEFPVEAEIMRPVLRDIGI